MLNTTLTICCLNWLRTVIIWCLTTSSSSKTARRLTRHVWRKTGSNSIVQTSSRKMSGLLIRQILIHLISMSGSHVGKVPGPHAQAQEQRWIEDRSSSDLGRSSTRAHRPRHPIVQKQTSDVHQSSGRSLWAPTVAANIMRVVTIKRPFSGPPHFQKWIEPILMLISLMKKKLF